MGAPELLTDLSDIMGTPKPVSRRRFLRAATVGGAAAFLGQFASYTDNDISFSEMTHDFGLYHPRDIEWGQVEARTEQCAIEENDKLRQPGPPSSAAIMVVHPGFIERDLKKIKQDMRYGTVVNGVYYSPEQYFGWEYMDTYISPYWQMVREERVSGTFTAYTDEVRSVTELDTRDIQKVSLLEYSAFKNRGRISETVPVDLLPHPNSWLVSTVSSDNTASTRISLPHDDVSQDPNLLYDWLKESGVRTIFMAGEYGHTNFSIGCLGGAAMELVGRGFEVRGIENAIFPASPPPKNWRAGMHYRFSHEEKAMYRQLYDSPVAVSELGDV